MSAKHRRAGEVWSFLDWKKARGMCSPMPRTCSLPGTSRRSWSSFFTCWGARLWVQSSMIWPCCISNRTSAGQILLPSGHAEYGILTDTEIQESALCTLLSPASPRAGATLLCPCSKHCKVCLCHWIPSRDFVQKPSVHSSRCLMEVSQPTLLFGDVDLVIALIDFEGYQ